MLIIYYFRNYIVYTAILHGNAYLFGKNVNYGGCGCSGIYPSPETAERCSPQTLITPFVPGMFSKLAL